MIRILLFLVIFIGLSLGLTAQSQAVDDLIESVLQNQEAESPELDFNDLSAQLLYLQDHPMDLNRVAEVELNQLGLLSSGQISAFMNYRSDVGDFLSIYELQAIPLWSVETIRLIMPFVKVADNSNVPMAPGIKTMLTGGASQLILRWSRILETTKAYNINENTGLPIYQGDPNRMYIRYQYRFGNFFKWGFTGEKDAGEPFFKANNKKGFDFYGFHAYASNLKPWLSAVAIGDYTVRLGQGLVLFQGFGYGKSAAVTSVRKGGASLRPYASVGEQGFMRGGAVSVRPFGQMSELTMFYSRLRTDANQVALEDQLDPLSENVVVSSLQISGLHRTLGEIEDKNAVVWTSVGGKLEFDNGRRSIAVNSATHFWDIPLQRGDALYNKYRFNGAQWWNGSVDYGYNWRNLNFFGEVAVDKRFSPAILQGLIAGLDRKTEAVLVYRNYPKDYSAPVSQGFGEQFAPNNEKGLYAGLITRPTRRWEWSGYVDMWEHPWLRFGIDGPSRGTEYWTRLTYTIKRKASFYGQFRSIQKAVGDTEAGAFGGITTSLRKQARLQASYQVMKGFEWRQRIEWSWYDEGGNSLARGFMIYQDFLIKPLSSPLSGSMRLALFDTGGYDGRIYAFENSVVFDPLIPAYYNKGSRYYINLRYKFARGWSLEGRIAQTFWIDQPTIGSGNDEIDKPQRTEVKAQLRYSF